MKSHRGAADILAELARRNGQPVTVTFQVTDRCNYECAHCYQEHADNNELSTAEIERILGEIADAGVLFLNLMGGEFFMRRDADDILRTAHELGFAIKLMTTGHHIGDRRADLIASLRPIQVDMSLYAATPHLHERVTRQEGSWQRTYSAARRLIARRVPVFLKAPVMEVNAGDLANVAELARQIGAEFTFDATITSMENGRQEPVALRMSAATLRAFYRDERSGVADFLAETSGRLGELGDAADSLDATPCRAGQQAVSINPRGQVKPCNGLPITCGDLRQQSFEDIWRGSSGLGEIRQLRWATIAECNVCELRRYCHRCHGMALLEQGEMRGPSLEACRHAVAERDALRDRGLIPATETALPPTWQRVHPDGLHHLSDSDDCQTRTIRRSLALRVLG
ncbi:MAG: radical SAM protein [Proteobacteria bacterium]|nr:radical SAM protein [Pseudomonadota bacterium]